MNTSNTLIMRRMHDGRLKVTVPNRVGRASANGFTLQKMYRVLTPHWRCDNSGRGDTYRWFLFSRL